MLADTGSPDNITGHDHVLRQGRIARKFKDHVMFEQLAKPEYIGGVGVGIITCLEQAKMPTCLIYCTDFKYVVAAIPSEKEGDSPTICIDGLESMVEVHTYFRTELGTLHMIPACTNDHIC